MVRDDVIVEYLAILEWMNGYINKKKVQIHECQRKLDEVEVDENYIG
jgi:hypothetical protein